MNTKALLVTLHYIIKYIIENADIIPIQEIWITKLEYLESSIQKQRTLNRYLNLSHKRKTIKRPADFYKKRTQFEF